MFCITRNAFLLLLQQSAQWFKMEKNWMCYSWSKKGGKCLFCFLIFFNNSVECGVFWLFSCWYLWAFFIEKNTGMNCMYFQFSFLVFGSTEFELRASHLLDRHFITWATHPYGYFWETRRYQADVDQTKFGNELKIEIVGENNLLRMFGGNKVSEIKRFDPWRKCVYNLFNDGLDLCKFNGGKEIWAERD
jgi:hypothetical protein